MAHTLDTASAVEFEGVSTDQAYEFTCGSGTTLLAVGLLTRAAARTSALLYGGVELASAIVHPDPGGSNKAEIWYQIDPTTGVATSLTVPVQAVGNYLLAIYTAKASESSVFNVIGYADGDGSYASATITPNTPGDFALDITATEANSSGVCVGNKTLLHIEDQGSYQTASQYELNPASSSTFTWGPWGQSDNWVQAVASFSDTGGAGSTTYDEDTTGVAVFSDTISALATANAGTTDGIVFADVLSALATATAAISEGLKAGDDWAAQLTQAVSQIEASRFSDVWTPSLILPGTAKTQISGLYLPGEIQTIPNRASIGSYVSDLVEALLAGDAWSSELTALASQAEKFGMGDSFSAGLTALIALADQAKLSAAFRSSLNALSASSDSIAVSELFRAWATASAGTSDGAVFADTFSSEILGLSSILSESGGFSEKFISTLSILATLSDTSAFSDAFSSLLQVARTTSDKAVLNELFTASVQSYPTLPEAVSFGDVFSSSIVGGAIELAMSEGSQWGDLFVSSINAISAFGERATFAEEFRGTLDVIGSLSDGWTVSDFYSSLITKRLTVSEQPVFSDAFSSSQVAYVSWVDSFSISDLWQSWITGTSTIREAIGLGDAFGASELDLTSRGRLIFGSVVIAARLAGTMTIKPRLDGEADIKRT